MSLFSRLFGNKPKSAATAKERLQLIILPKMQKELIAVISKYVSINPDDIKVSLEKQGNYEVLEVNIVLPEPDGQTADKADPED